MIKKIACLKEERAEEREVAVIYYMGKLPHLQGKRITANQDTGPSTPHRSPLMLRTDFLYLSPGPHEKRGRRCSPHQRN